MMEWFSSRICCFFGGNFLTIAFVSVETLLQTVVLGLVGGLVGMFARDLYNWLKGLL